MKTCKRHPKYKALRKPADLTPAEIEMVHNLRSVQQEEQRKRLQPLVDAIEIHKSAIIALRNEIDRVQDGGAYPKCTCDQQWTDRRCPARLKGYRCHAW